MCACACSKLYAPSTNVATYNSLAGWLAHWLAGRQFSLAKILASAMFAQVQNCAITQLLRSLREIVNISSQFAVFCFRFTVLTQLLSLSLCISVSLCTGLTCSLHMILERHFPFVFVFVISPTPTRTHTGVTRGQSLRRWRLKAILHSFSLNLSCCSAT